MELTSLRNSSKRMAGYRYIDTYFGQKTRTEENTLFMEFCSYRVKIFLSTLYILIKLDAA